MRLIHDAKNNALRIVLDDEPGVPSSSLRLRGLVDVAAGGRLVGIEFRPGDHGSTVRRSLHRWLEDSLAGEFMTLEPDGRVYIELTSGDAQDHVRSSPLDLTAEFDTSGELLAVSIPRRGAGYEISYPSGNR